MVVEAVADSRTPHWAHMWSNETNCDMKEALRQRGDYSVCSLWINHLPVPVMGQRVQWRHGGSRVGFFRPIHQCRWARCSSSARNCAFKDCGRTQENCQRSGEMLKPQAVYLFIYFLKKKIRTTVIKQFEDISFLIDVRQKQLYTFNRIETRWWTTQS